jgi:hypothetical protein
MINGPWLSCNLMLELMRIQKAMDVNVVSDGLIITIPKKGDGGVHNNNHVYIYILYTYEELISWLPYCTCFERTMEVNIPYSCLNHVTNCDLPRGQQISLELRFFQIGRPPRNAWNMFFLQEFPLNIGCLPYSPKDVAKHPRK